MRFSERWLAAVKAKNSLLCVGIDPAATLSAQAKCAWALDLIGAVAPHAAAIKINRNCIKDLSRSETRTLTEAAHRFAMVIIDDAKLADIGTSNEAGIAHAAAEGFDAVTYAPFPGNWVETAAAADSHGLGLIMLVLMSNPDYAVIKSAQIDGKPAYQHFATAMRGLGDAGMVIGAPSPANHLSAEEIATVRDLAGPRLVLVPGLGAQGGEIKSIIRHFGDLTMANVGRDIAQAADPRAAAIAWQQKINQSR